MKRIVVFSAGHYVSFPIGQIDGLADINVVLFDNRLSELAIALLLRNLLFVHLQVRFQQVSIMLQFLEFEKL